MPEIVKEYLAQMSVDDAERFESIYRNNDVFRKVVDYLSTCTVEELCKFF